MTVNHDTLNALVGKMLKDLGGALSVPTVPIGFRLGLCKWLQDDGPAMSDALAERLGLAPRYVREGALAQAANGYVSFDSAAEQFSLSPEQSMVFAIADSPLYHAGAGSRRGTRRAGRRGESDRGARRRRLWAGAPRERRRV